MTRIIAGFAGSLPLAVPRSGSRPTSDRVREAIFSALESRDAIRGARVLDLYAGSGGLGLEAVSRGAVQATLVERNAAAAAVCRQNAATVAKAAGEAAPRVDVIVRPVRSFLTETEQRFDLVFLDPPYDLSDTALAEALDALVPRLEPGTVVVLERAARSGEPLWPHGLEARRSSRYGDTAVWVAQAG